MQRPAEITLACDGPGRPALAPVAQARSRPPKGVDAATAVHRRIAMPRAPAAALVLDANSLKREAQSRIEALHVVRRREPTDTTEVHFDFNPSSQNSHACAAPASRTTVRADPNSIALARDQSRREDHWIGMLAETIFRVNRPGPPPT